ncbi:MAG: ATP-binding protein [Gammaproteobacteria bacterium]|nr:ATP-binding protein [Gammaproteobacteria bacterium]
MNNIDIKTVVHEAISLAQKTSTKKNVTINNNVDTKSTSVLADATRLRQVIVNILSNAVKYNNDNGHVDINIKKNHDDTVELSICDTGIGIPEHAMQELFTPFNRLGAEKSDVEGNGLGLATCQQLMKLMHGDIGAYNNPDAGSTFWLKLQTPSADINDNKQALAN